MILIHELFAHSGPEELIDLSFELEPGSTLGVIGRSNSGKNLLGKVLSGSVNLTKGRITYNHYNLISSPIRSRAMLGYLPNPIAVDTSLTGYEFLDLVGSIYRLAPKERTKIIQELLKTLNIDEEIHSLLEYSLPSTKKKVAIAASLMHQPNLLILDEPLADLDLVDRDNVTQYLSKYVAENRSMIIISDDEGLIENLSDKLLILSEGQLLFLGTKKQLINQTGSSKKALVESIKLLMG